NLALATEPLTDALGRYSVNYRIPASQAPLGLTAIQAAFGITGVIDPTITLPVNLNITATSQLTVQAIPNSVRLNSSTTLQGQLQYENGTGIAGQDVGLYWNGTAIGSTTTNGAGFFSMNYDLINDTGQVLIEANFSGAPYIYGSRASNTLRVHEEGSIIIFVNDDDLDNVTQRGNTVYFTGWVENQTGTGQGGVTVRIYLNQSMILQTVTLFDGSFYVSYQLETTLSVGTMEVTGDIIHPTLQVISSVDYFVVNSTTQIRNLTFDMFPVMLGEFVTFTGQIIDDQGVGLSGQILNIDGSYAAVTIPLGTVNTQPDGTFSFLFAIPMSIPTDIGSVFFDVTYSGTAYYGVSINSEGLDVFSNASLLIETPFSSIAWNASVLVNGTLFDNFGRALANRDIQLFVNGTSNISTASDPFGRVSFALRFTPDGVIDTVYSLQLRHETVITINSIVSNIIVEAEEIMQTPPPLYFPIELIIPIIIVIVIIVVAVLGYRYWKRRPRQPTAPSIDAAAMLTSLRQLLTSKKYREAIIYAFRMFETIIQAKLGIYRDPSITLREFANLTVAHGRLDSRTMESFIRGVEEARFSDHPISYNTALMTLNSFASIYNSLTGGNLRFVTQEQQQPAPDTEQSESS
ncbi:MAG: DUF4129 domain-containing protein, partial [Candidatus Thorarchaeota archaeon]